MAEDNEPSAEAQADAMSMLEEVEAEVAEAEALAAAARARKRAARLRRETVREPDSAEAHSYSVAQAAADSDETEVVETLDYPVDTDDAHDAAAEPEPKPVAAPGRRRLAALPLLAKLAAVVLILAFTGLSVFMVLHHNEAKQRQQRTAAFVAGARTGVINMTSLDYNKAKEDVQRVIDSSTGEFRDDFQRRATDFTKVVQQSKVVTEGTVNAAALESMDEHSALVLVSATSRVTNSTGAKDEPRVWRLRVTVTEDGGQYKMSKVEFVP
ncbi:MAG: hypothetical protein JO236_21580 [Mycobacterium sp.]|uniref:hypothetical protein n=1 Tax=Mycobacterium sp. TaxID=1785 RepID=UPI001EC51599|nr:hypothetical protein [Mycobacterium sp.]MBW0020113.1 hypothetical protein [Mycobacterium sp.]